jgi:methyl-accepting chemotaxis protein
VLPAGSPAVRVAFDALATTGISTMFVSKTQEVLATLAALNRSHAVIEFKMDGTIITANANFLTVIGYRLPDIRGRPHAIFAAAKDHRGSAYQRFWDGLSRGEFQSGEYPHIGRHGREVWLQACFNPILKRNGKPYKVIAFATDITARKRRETGRETARDAGPDGPDVASRLSPEAVVRRCPAGPVGSGSLVRAPGRERLSGEIGSDGSEPASRIGNVIDTINRIAAENNLAALRATIEAARAGEATGAELRPRLPLRRLGGTA